MKNKILLLIAGILISTASFSQSTKAGGGTGNLRTNNTDFIGWDNTGINGSIQLRNDFDNIIELHTNNIRRMTILGGPITSGFVGIGTATPTRRLNVIDDIDLTAGTFPGTGYRWNDTVVLKTNFVGTNIFLGAFAGNNMGGGTSNTYLGDSAGFSHNGNNGGNTFVGWHAGSDGLDPAESVFIGSRSGEFNNGNNNCFIGVLAGRGNAPLTVTSLNVNIGQSSGIANTGNNTTFIGAFTGRINSQNDNTFVGFSSGNFNTAGRGNTFVGANTGFNNDIGSNLTFLGFQAGFNNLRDNNTFVGSTSGFTNNTGTNNSFFGFESGFSNERGSQNTFIGASSGLDNITGNDNTFTGFLSGSTNTVGINNSFFGSGAGESNDDDQNNTFIGFECGNLLNNGNLNTFIGSQSGDAITSGTEVTLLGAGTTASNGRTNATAIGAGADVQFDDNIILGNNDVNVGIGLSGNSLSGPQTKLEINADNNNESGLRFRQLTSGSPVSVTGVTRVLTVDGSGDVILGEIPGAGGAVNACGAGLTNTDFITKISGPNEICSTVGLYELPIAPNTVGIGVGAAVNTGPTNNFKLDLKGDLYIRHDINNSIGGDIWMLDHFNIRRPVFAMYGSNGFGALAVGPNAGSNNQFASINALNSIYMGLNAGSASLSTRNNTFIGYNAGQNYNGANIDGYNTLIGSDNNPIFNNGSFNTFVGDNSGRLIDGSDNVMIGQTTYINNGVTSTPMNGDRNIIIGAKAHLIGGAGVTNILNSVSLGYSNRVTASNFIGMAFQVNPGVMEQQVGFGYPAPPAVLPAPFPAGGQAKLYVNNYMGGPISAYFNGDVYAAGNFIPSDSALKNNISPFLDASTIINQLEAKSYVFKHSTYPGLNLPQGDQIGFLAEDIAAVMPNLVTSVSSPAKYDSLGNQLGAQVNFDAVNYTGLIPVLFTAIKQQQAQLDSLALVVSSCCASPIIDPSQNNKASISLSNNEAIVLNQNVPNPFADNTEITYNIPESVQSAMIMFYDQNGKILQQHEVSHRGAGSLTVYSDDLTSGIYTYTLIVDGKNHQTKRMMKQ